MFAGGSFLLFFGGIAGSKAPEVEHQRGMLVLPDLIAKAAPLLIGVEGEAAASGEDGVGFFLCKEAGRDSGVEDDLLICHGGVLLYLCENCDCFGFRQHKLAVIFAVFCTVSAQQSNMLAIIPVHMFYDAGKHLYVNYAYAVQFLACIITVVPSVRVVIDWAKRKRHILHTHADVFIIGCFSSFHDLVVKFACDTHCVVLLWIVCSVCCDYIVPFYIVLCNRQNSQT
uniref:Uncharacterized protein n=1 Tax=Myoviridae sp. ctbWL16 TaxID=2826668 RepID=A0A8S5MSQ3_9CAUD|nr:MAG TPA: hypothetical protein [Myoviridae sp. ctbWL16]